MELLPNDVLWLILKKVISDYFNKEYEKIYSSRKRKIVVSSEECANCSPLKKELILQGLCNQCEKLATNGYIIKHTRTMYGTTLWTCGCRNATAKYYCSLHRYMNIEGPLGCFSKHDYGGITMCSSLGLFMYQLSKVSHKFRNISRSKCTWFNTWIGKIWIFNKNILQNSNMLYDPTISNEQSRKDKKDQSQSDRSSESML